ncbi:DNA adenine methylase [Fodinicola feengrottensis]|uniref:DNA adenine methylase n=1 Tax=Fodinicola feengrottensis TaxID=435914 RepID=A0ABN2IM04_9ACTN|nr:DNA adenine methylase [Fodinicola feengrottensis]
MNVKPPFAYYGGKTRIAARIAERMPAHQHYVEPFAGSLAVLLAKRPAAMETVNDLDGDLMLFWRVLRDRTAELVRACALTPHGRAEHQAAYDLNSADEEIERARRIWVLLSQGWTGGFTRTGWRLYLDPAGSGTSMPGYLTGYVERMAAVAERLHAVSLECRPALEIIEAYGAHKDVLIYADPPYLGSARNSVKYRHEMTSDASHRELAALLTTARACVVLSGYPSPLYDQLYAGWDRVEFHAVTAQGGAGGRRTEVLWSNRQISTPSLFGNQLASLFDQIA